MPRLHVIVASTRPGRVGPVIADWFVGRARALRTFDVHLVDLAEVNLPLLDEPDHPSERRYTKPHTRAWSESVGAADAFTFVMPEYNRGFTAPLKNALDYLDAEWHDKPVGFVSYGMTSGGLRAVEMITPVVSALRMVPVPDLVCVHLRQRLDADGRLRPDDVMEAAAQRLLAGTARMAGALRVLRTTEPEAALSA
jgi:NAD(P)H-dependent FMN reductase